MTDRDDLANQLEELLEESAVPVTIDEVVERARSIPSSGSGRRRARRAVVAGVVVAVVAVAIAVTVGVRDRSSSPALSVAPSTTVPAAATTTTGVTTSIAPTTNADPADSLPQLPDPAVRTYRFGPNLEIEQAVPVDGALWLVGYQSTCHVAACPSLFRLDQATGRVTGLASSSGAGGIGIAESGDAIWFLSDQPNGSPYTVSRVNAVSGRVELSVPVPGTHVFGNTNPIGRIAVGFGSVWVYDGGESIVRLDAATGAVITRIALPDSLGANGLAADSHGVWAVAYGNTEVMRVDPTSNTAAVVKRFPVGFTQSIDADDDFVWTTHVTTDTDLALWRIDASDPTAADNTRIPTADVSVGGRRVWFFGWEPGAQADSVLNHPSLVGQVDPSTLRVTGVTELPTIDPDDDTSFVADGRDAWVVDSTTDTVWRVSGR